MNIYNVGLVLQNTWYEVTIPRGIKNYLISSAGTGILEVRRRGETAVRVIGANDTLEVLDRRLTEQITLEIRCPLGAGEVGEVVVW